MSKSSKKSIYSVHPGVAMMQKWVAELPQKTGRSLEQWLALVKREGPSTEKERREWLKQKHGLGTNAASWIAERADGKGWEDSDPDSYLQATEKWVEEMFSGSKAGLRPIYDNLLSIGLRIGKEVKACPCRTIVPLYRNHVIAQIKPATRTRIDFGLALGNLKTPKRLINTGGYEKKDRITHRFEISALDQVDEEVKKWLKVAYERDA